MNSSMRRSILIYALALAAAAFAMQWIEHQYLTQAFTIEIYIGLIGVGFTVLGIWLGRALTSRRNEIGFELNEAALKSLGITQREYTVLQHIAWTLKQRNCR